MMFSKLTFAFLLLKLFLDLDQVVEMREISPTLTNGEHQPGLESQGRAASMPRLAAETQVSREGGFLGWETESEPERQCSAFFVLKSYLQVL